MTTNEDNDHNDHKKKQKQLNIVLTIYHYFWHILHKREKEMGLF